jgi:Phage terminase, small subunit
MATTPPLHLVSDFALTGLNPPRTLGKPGRSLWDRVQLEYSISDIGGIEMLAQACAALDRAEALSAEIERDGAVIKVHGSIREHPALKAELACRSFIVRTLQRLGLDVGPVRSSVGRPGGPRVGR